MRDIGKCSADFVFVPFSITQRIDAFKIEKRRNTFKMLRLSQRIRHYLIIRKLTLKTRVFFALTYAYIHQFARFLSFVRLLKVHFFKKCLTRERFLAFNLYDPGYLCIFNREYLLERSINSMLKDSVFD